MSKVLQAYGTDVFLKRKIAKNILSILYGQSKDFVRNIQIKNTDGFTTDYDSKERIENVLGEYERDKQNFFEKRLNRFIPYSKNENVYSYRLNLVYDIIRQQAVMSLYNYGRIPKKNMNEMLIGALKNLFENKQTIKTIIEKVKDEKTDIKRLTSFIYEKLKDEGNTPLEISKKIKHINQVLRIKRTNQKLLGIYDTSDIHKDKKTSLSSIYKTTIIQTEDIISRKLSLKEKNKLKNILKSYATFSLNMTLKKKIMKELGVSSGEAKKIANIVKLKAEMYDIEEKLIANKTAFVLSINEEQKILKKYDNDLELFNDIYSGSAEKKNVIKKIENIYHSPEEFFLDEESYKIVKTIGYFSRESTGSYSTYSNLKDRVFKEYIPKKFFYEKIINFYENKVLLPNEEREKIKKVFRFLSPKEAVNFSLYSEIFDFLLNKYEYRLKTVLDGLNGKINKMNSVLSIADGVLNRFVGKEFLVASLTGEPTETTKEIIKIMYNFYFEFLMKKNRFSDKVPFFTSAELLKSIRNLALKYGVGKDEETVKKIVAKYELHLMSAMNDFKYSAIKGLKNYVDSGYLMGAEGYLSDRMPHYKNINFFQTKINGGFLKNLEEFFNLNAELLSVPSYDAIREVARNYGKEQTNKNLSELMDKIKTKLKQTEIMKTFEREVEEIESGTGTKFMNISTTALKKYPGFLEKVKDFVLNALKEIKIDLHELTEKDIENMVDEVSEILKKETFSREPEIVKEILNEVQKTDENAIEKARGILEYSREYDRAKRVAIIAVRKLSLLNEKYENEELSYLIDILKDN